MVTDPTSIQFRMPGGDNVAETDHVFDALLKNVPSGIEVYQYQTTWLPLASRVEVFDGYTLQDITSSRRSDSFFLHFAGHWLGYVVALLGGIFLLGWSLALQAIPKRRVVLRYLGRAVWGLVGLVFVYDLVLYEPLSLVIVIVGAALLFVAHDFLRRRIVGRRGVGASV